jgi:hypothetical protein
MAPSPKLTLKPVQLSTDRLLGTAWCESELDGCQETSEVLAPASRWKAVVLQRETGVRFLSATELANDLISNQNRNREQKDCVSLADTTAWTFAVCIISSKLSWHSGFVARINEDHDDNHKPAIYCQPLSLKLFGRQCDLEWIHVVDLRSNSIDVYGGGYESPEEIVPRGVVDPTSYADQLIPEALVRERTAIAAHMGRLMEMGRNLNGSAEPVRPVKKRTLRKKAVAV